jgi:spore coat polysaccharide biosynthesis protein SpsF
MGSSRLPGKVLMPLAGQPALWHVVQRLRAQPLVDAIYVATSTLKQDDPIADFVAEVEGTRLFRGSEDDVLARFYHCVKDVRPEIVLRVTGDVPLVSLRHMTRLLNRLIEREDLDGVASTYKYSGLPVGFGHEAYRFAALEIAHVESSLPAEREHVTTFIKTHPDRFNVEIMAAEEALRGPFRFALDYPEDYALLQTIYDRLYRPGETIDTLDVIELMKSDPDLAGINADCEQNVDPAQTVLDSLHGRS